MTQLAKELAPFRAEAGNLCACNADQQVLLSETLKLHSLKLPSPHVGATVNVMESRAILSRHKSLVYI